MTVSQLDYSRFERLVTQVAPGSVVLRVWALTGGVSAQVTALEVQHPDGQTQKWVVRRHGAPDLSRNPFIAQDEFKLLSILHTAGIAVPRPYHVEPPGELWPTSCLITEYIDGQPDFAPADLDGFPHQFATHLAKIHRISGAPLDLTFLPQPAQNVTAMLKNQPSNLDVTLDERRIRATLKAVWPLSPRNSPVVLHGDYWPGNVLCRQGRIVAIIDWEDAAFGDPLADLANARLETLWAFGVEAMEQFTRQYQAMTPFDVTDLLYWDLAAALRPITQMGGWGLAPDVEHAMRDKHRWFVADAFQRLSGQ